MTIQRTLSGDSRLAFVDVVVDRSQLDRAGTKRDVRIALYAKALELGSVDQVVRYVMDPPDGPYRDGTIAEAAGIDWDRSALIRLVAWITPRR